MVSSMVVVKEEGCPFIVCMAYAFHTTDKLCFILDLMNGRVLINIFLYESQSRKFQTSLLA